MPTAWRTLSLASLGTCRPLEPIRLYSLLCSCLISTILYLLVASLTIITSSSSLKGNIFRRYPFLDLSTISSGTPLLSSTFSVVESFVKSMGWSIIAIKAFLVSNL
ncbi:hypothetical protein MBAV_006290 [Candidatus Magnetobacterium bavaricum]|uniref:Uncharacterized protein n=1 Tax=Candidatus Magnetobacterium bavaricum TaxID=29290 RepID=A0A0F3GI04_9BACT|nr:hypothetical protein MBAV_006290 [Candidatus Magnetobacterium bavaricum]